MELRNGGVEREIQDDEDIGIFFSFGTNALCHNYCSMQMRDNKVYKIWNDQSFLLKQRNHYWSEPRVGHT